MTRHLGIQIAGGTFNSKIKMYRTKKNIFKRAFSSDVGFGIELFVGP